MYGYSKYAPLNKEEILNRATEEEIFNIVIQGEITEGSYYKAPYRIDNIGDCYFERYEGKLTFVDFASPYPIKAMDCFNIIGYTFNASFTETLEIINDKLSLGLGDNIGKVRDKIPERNKVEERIVKKVIKERVITFLPRQFSYKDKKFWSKYEITKQNLIDDKVIPISLYKSISRSGKPFVIKPFDICYIYTEFKGNRRKVYRPYAPDKQAKWFTNCNQNDIGSIKHLVKKGDKLIITKSYKDCRVLRNQGVNSIWFQNEGMIPSKEILIKLLKRFKEIIIWYDNDNTGIGSSKMISEYLQSLNPNIIVRTVILPPKLLQENIKDPADYIASRGKQALLDFMKQKNLL